MTFPRIAALLLASAPLCISAIQEDKPSLPPAPSPTPDTRPSDRPVQMSQKEMDRLTAPYVKMSRDTFPKARERFLAGLPEGHRFYVVLPIYDDPNHTFEQVFLAVDRIDGDKIIGTINSE